jgi:eukaryotic-like serine/threonine-protein kinase
LIIFVTDTKQIIMGFFKFIISRVFIKNLLIAMGIFFVIIFSTLLWLRTYTQHSSSMSVPNFTGLSLEEVDIIARSKILRIEVADSSFSEDIPKGTVIRQNPIPGSMVKEGRRIYLTMNAMNPEMVVMPNVTGVSMRQAKAILETYGLFVGNLSYKPNIAVNNVLEQRTNNSVVVPGELVKKGSYVDLVLGMGLSMEKTPVPDLTGMNFDIAKNILVDRYLNFGAIIYDNTVLTAQDSIDAIIWRQRPEFANENRLNLGAHVDVWLTINPVKLSEPGDSISINENADEDL